MTKNKRFELTIDEKGYASIIDWVESKEKNAHCIYNDLGVIPFTSAKAVCNKLNEQEETIQEYKHLVKIATNIIEWNTVPQIRRAWQKYLNKDGDMND